MTPEEAVRHAVQAELDRMPPFIQARYKLDLDGLSKSLLAGEENDQTKDFDGLVSIGRPEHEPADDFERKLQDLLLSKYTGTGWTPEELKRLGREPEPYEMSHGAQMAHQMKERRRLFTELERARTTKAAAPMSIQSPFGAVPSFAPQRTDEVARQQAYDVATKNYADSTVREKALFSSLGNEVDNPENFLGTYLTKMGPVLSDGFSLAATNALDGDPNTSILGGFTDAASRSYGADWNRTSPQLTADQGWRENDALIRRMREAYRDSQGMTSGDTFRATFGGHVPGIQPLINGAMSFGNGLLDMSSLAGALASAPVKAVAAQTAKAGVPGVSNYAAGVAKDIGRAGWGARTMQEVGDETLDVTNVAATGAHFFAEPKKETGSEFNARIAEESQRRSAAIKALEQEQNSIRRPQTMYQKNIAEPIGQAVGNAVGGFMR